MFYATVTLYQNYCTVMIKICYCLFLVIVIFNFNVQSYFESELIEEVCQKKCLCKHKQDSTKIQVAHCVVEENDNFVYCNVEWPVLLLTIKKLRFNSALLSSCKRIKRLMITATSSMVVLMPEMFQSNSDVEILVVQAPIQTMESQFMKYLNSLKQLDISETRIERLSKSMFWDCPVTDRIRLSSNRIFLIGDRTFENCMHLIKLDLSHNELSAINILTFNKADKLEFLDLSKNKISTIDDYSFKNLPKLRILNLSKNILKTIRKNTFANIDNLTHLILEGNNIDFIVDEAFLTLKQIKVINLKNNFFQRLDIALFQKLYNLKNVLINSDLKCVIERNIDNFHVSMSVRKRFEKFNLCSGKRSQTHLNDNGSNEKLTQKNDTFNKMPTDISTSNKKKNSIYDYLGSDLYLFPMIFGALTVTIISIIVIALVCHVKNKEINNLKLQDIPLPMMASTL